MSELFAGIDRAVQIVEHGQKRRQKIELSLLCLAIERFLETLAHFRGLAFHSRLGFLKFRLNADKLRLRRLASLGLSLELRFQGCLSGRLCGLIEQSFVLNRSRAVGIEPPFIADRYRLLRRFVDVYLFFRHRYLL